MELELDAICQSLARDRDLMYNLAMSHYKQILGYLKDENQVLDDEEEHGRQIRQQNRARILSRRRKRRRYC